MAYVIGVLVMVVGVAVSIALHEIGHLVPAKKFGVKVTQYMIGFGPTIFSRKRGETEYGVKWIPAGGYIRMIGMFPPQPSDEQPEKRRLSWWSAIAKETRNASAQEIAPGDEARTFYRLSVPKKLVVMLGGPTMNLIFAAVLLGVVLVGIGLPGASTTVGSVSTCVIGVSEPDRDCTPSDPAAPAMAAGVKPGDRLVSFNGVAISSWSDFSRLVRDSDATAIPLVVERDGKQLTLELTPLITQRPQLDADGYAITAADGTILTTDVGFAGVSAATQLQRQPITEVPGVVGSALVRTGEVIITLPQRLVGISQAAFGSGERDPNGPVGVVGVGRFAGEIATADVAGYGVTERVADLLGLLASLNIALFVFNMLPLLPLDGGHVAGAVWEGIRRTAARLRRRPDPGPVDVANAMPIAYGVFALLAVMSLVLVYADFVRPIQLLG